MKEYCRFCNMREATRWLLWTDQHGQQQLDGSCNQCFEDHDFEGEVTRDEWLLAKMLSE